MFEDDTDHGIIIGSGISGAKTKYFNNEGIYTPRIPVTKEFYKNLSPEEYKNIKYKLNSLANFGNPFGVTGKGGTQMEFPNSGSPEEVSKLYGQWLLGSLPESYYYKIKSTNTLKKLAKQRNFILQKLSQGILTDNKLIYYKSSDKLTHAKVLRNLAKIAKDIDRSMFGKGYVNHSGGAAGPDSIFEAIGILYGAETNGYYYDEKLSPNGNKSLGLLSNLSQADQARYDKKYLDSLTPLGRFKAKEESTRSLLKRNIAQVDGGDSIYAVAPINQKTKTETVSGGTGYAVEYAKQDKKPIFVFHDKDHVDNTSDLDTGWYEWSYDKNSFEKLDKVPVLTKNFAGIGSRKVTPGMISAVEDLYSSTASSLSEKAEPKTQTSTEEVSGSKVESEQGSSTRTGDQLFDPSLGDMETKTEINFQEEGSGIFDIFSGYVSTEMENGYNGTNPFYSQEFMENIEQVLTGFDNVLQKTDYSKITLRDIKLSEEALFDAANSNRDTAGTLKTFADRSAELTIRYNKAFGTATKSEIFMHEMIHFMIHRAIQNNPELKKAIQNLKEQVHGTGLTYEIFLQSMQVQGRQPTAADIESAKDKYEYAFGKYSDPEEFMAYALSNQDLFHTIKNFVPEQGVIDAFKMNDTDGKAIGSMKKLLNAFINMINRIWSSNVQVGGKSAAMLLTETVNKLAEEQFNLDMNDHIDKDAFMKGDLSTLDEWDEKMKPHVARFDAKVLNLTQAIKKKESFKKIGEKMKDVFILGRIVESNFFQSILSTITKKTDDSKWADVYALYRQGKNNMEKHRQGVSEAIERLVEGYVEGVDSGTRDAITTVIFNTDLGSLIDVKNGIGYSELDVILDDNNDHLDSLYKNALYDIEKFYNAKGRKAFGPFASTSEEMLADIEQAKGLAKMMANGVAYSSNQQINANNIYNKFYTSTLEYDSELGIHVSSVDANRTNTEEDKVIIEKLNRFITIAALKETPSSDRKLISNYLGNETNAKNMKSILNMYNEYVVKKADMLKVANAYDPIQKGYFDQLNRANMTFELIPEDDVAYHTGRIGRMKNIGYYGTIGGTKYYKVVGHEYSSDFDEGMLSIAGNPIPGKSLKSLLAEQMREEDKKLSKRDKRSSSKVDEIVEDKIIQFVNSGGKDTSIISFDGDWNAIPVYDMRGRIIDYKLDISRQEKVKHLGSELDVVKSAAYTFSKFTHREASLIHNEKVIDKMLDYSKTNYLDDPEDFVMIEKYPDNGEDENGNHVKFDENIHGRWNTIPEYTRKYIFEKTGSHRLVIPQDMVELIIGEKGATIGNFNLGPIDMRNFKRLRKLLIIVEGLSGEILKWAKETIVIRTGSVVLSNLISNMAVAWMRAGIPPHVFLKEARKKWIELNEYRDLDEKYQNVMAEYNASGSEDATLKRQIGVLRTRIHNHPFHKLVADGQFSVIIEDVNVGDAPSGRIATFIEDVMNNKRVPQGVRSVKEFVSMDRNTAMFKGMMKLTQYGDVITRQIMFEKMQLEAKRRGHIMTDDDIQGLLNMLDQLFVNYGYIDNRYLRYMDKHAGVWFTKYFFRQLKAMQTVVSAAPAYYSSFIAAEALSGLDVATPDDSYYQPVDSLVNRMHFLHPGNIIETLTTSPLFNFLPNPIGDTVDAGKGLVLDWS